MINHDYINYHKRIISLPYYNNEGGYHLAINILYEDPLYTEIQECDQSELFEHHIQILTNHVISSSDADVWFAKQIAKGTMLEYQSRLEDFRRALTPHILALTNEFGEEWDLDKVVKSKDCIVSGRETPQSINVSQVLNKNNPFADVAISDQQFIYRSTDDSFQTLSFVTNNTLSKITAGEEAYLALKPGFKINKSADRKQADKDIIIMDDTISTKIVEDTDDKMYVYFNQ